MALTLAGAVVGFVLFGLFVAWRDRRDTQRRIRLIDELYEVAQKPGVDRQTILSGAVFYVVHTTRRNARKLGPEFIAKYEELAREAYASREMVNASIKSRRSS